MFKGKVVIYKTDPRTGKVYQVEKEFTDPKEYEQFLAQHPEFSVMHDFSDFGPKFSLGEWTALEKWIEDLLQKRFGLWLGYEQQPAYYGSKSSNYEELPVDLSRYEFEAKRLEEEKRKQEEKIRKLEEALNKLKNYKKQFEESWKTDLLKQIEEDIKKVEEELKKLRNSKQNKKKNKK